MSHKNSFYNLRGIKYFTLSKIININLVLITINFYKNKPPIVIHLNEYQLGGFYFLFN